MVPTTLTDFTHYPHVKPQDISKSHYQQLSYTTWWHRHAKSSGDNWRYVWCMEHDVAFTGGNWRVVFDSHATNPVKARLDFVSWQVGWTPKITPVHGGGAGEEKERAVFVVV